MVSMHFCSFHLLVIWFSGSIHYLDENLLVYAAGSHVILYNTESRQQLFLHNSQPTDWSLKPEICALAVAAKDKYTKYVAVAEK